MSAQESQRLISRFCVKLGREHGFELYADIRKTLATMGQVCVSKWGANDWQKYNELIDALCNANIDCDLLMQAEIAAFNKGLSDET